MSLVPDVITANAKTHFGMSESATAFCWLLVPRLSDAPAQPSLNLGEGWGAPEGYTSLDADLEIEGVTFRSVAAILPASLPGTIGLETDGVEATLLFPEQLRLLRERVEAGLYDGALARLFGVAWEALQDGAPVADCVWPLVEGTLGNAEVVDEAANFELLPWSSYQNTNVGRMTGPACDCSRFGRGRCLNLILRDGVDIRLHGRTIGGSIAPIPDGDDASGMRFWLQLDAARPDGWADFGVLRFESGPLKGAEFPVKQWRGTGEVLLRVPCLVVPDVGTRIALEEGCDRQYKTCRTKEPNPDAPTGRGNILQFQGYDSPGQRKLVEGDG